MPEPHKQIMARERREECRRANIARGYKRRRLGMQMVEGLCTQCGGDGDRQKVGHSRWGIDTPKCTHCKGTGMEPVKWNPRVGESILRILRNQKQEDRHV